MPEYGLSLAQRVSAYKYVSVCISEPDRNEFLSFVMEKNNIHIFVLCWKTLNKAYKKKLLKYYLDYPVFTLF